VIIWYFLSTPVLIGGYEFFTDDWHWFHFLFFVIYFEHTDRP
jgi:hypothetical protein